jgi:apolipoprotein D and lipocalin family protein
MGGGGFVFVCVFGVSRANADFVDYTGDFAIVQASNFTTLFVLSREQQVADNVIDAWIARAGKLGSNLADVVKTNQTGCI